MYFPERQILGISPIVYLQNGLFDLNMVLWYLQTFMSDSCSLTLPEPESVECQIGTLGANV